MGKSTIYIVHSELDVAHFHDMGIMAVKLGPGKTQEDVARAFPGRKVHVIEYKD